MVEPHPPAFADPGSYIKYYGSSITMPNDISKKFRYIRLLESEGPLRYPYNFPNIASDVVGASVTFSDLDPAIGHVYQAFLGVQLGTWVQVFTPFDTRLLNWDSAVNNISTAETAVLTHGLSPYEGPRFEIWIPPNKQYPAIVPINKSAILIQGGKSIIPQIIFLAKSFRITEITPQTDPEIYDMLDKKKIPSTPVRFGGTIRSIPR